MSSRFKNTLYTIGDYKHVDGHIRYVTNDDGTLFSGHYRTKIKPEDLPEWYLYGRYHKRFGYMSTKGITDSGAVELACQRVSGMQRKGLKAIRNNHKKFSSTIWKTSSLSAAVPLLSCSGQAKLPPAQKMLGIKQ